MSFAVTRVLRFCDLRAAEGMQVVAWDLCSLCWSCGVALVVFGVGLAFVAVFGCQYGSFVWGCGLVGLGMWACFVERGLRLLELLL